MNGQGASTPWSSWKDGQVSCQVAGRGGSRRSKVGRFFEGPRRLNAQTGDEGPPNGVRFLEGSRKMNKDTLGFSKVDQANKVSKQRLWAIFRITAAALVIPCVGELAL